MKTKLLPLLVLSLFSVSSLALTLEFNVSIASCGEVSASQGDACGFLGEDKAGKNYTAYFDFDEFIDMYDDEAIAKFEGKDVIIKNCSASQDKENLYYCGSADQIFVRASSMK